MNREQAATESGALGARLARARERLGWSQAQAAEKLHLDSRAVAAMEGEDFATLGAPVYVRGHLRRYAELLGESSSDIEALYNVRRGSQPAPDMLQSFTVTEKQLRPPSRITPRTVFLVALGLILAALVIWALRRAAVPAPADAAASQSESAPPAASQPAFVAATGVPTMERREQPASAASPPAAPAATPASPTAPRRRSRLTLHFTDATTITVADATGRQLLAGDVVGGSGRTLRGRAPFVITIGNAAAVGLVLDDRPVLLTAAMRDTPNLQVQVEGDGLTSQLH